VITPGIMSTERDELIADLYASGHSQRGIARTLGISQPAVRKHLLKLGVLRTGGDNLGNPNIQPDIPQGELLAKISIEPPPMTNGAQEKARTLLRYVGEALTRAEQEAWGRLIVLAVDVLEGKRTWGEE